MASARRMHEPSVTPRLCEDAAQKRFFSATQKCSAAKSNASRTTKKNRWRGSIRVGAALALIACTFLLLPKQVGHPVGAPADADSPARSMTRQSVAALYSTPYSSEPFSTHLTWTWNLANGKSKATLMATVLSREASGSLVFGGPISGLVNDCILNGKPVEPSAGMPDRLGFNPPQNAQFWFSGREVNTVSRIDFRGDPGPGGTVILCEVQDFAADDPPIHRLYTPTLLAYSQGSESAVEDGSRLRSVCVEVPRWSKTEAAEECADAFNVVPLIYDHEQLLDLPEEQGIRDAKLLIVGAVAGTAAATLLEFLPGTLSALAKSVRGLLGAFKRRDRTSPDATTHGSGQS